MGIFKRPGSLIDEGEIMPAKCNVAEQVNPFTPDFPQKYYPSYTSSGKVKIRQLAGQIDSISTVNSIDTLAVLEAFLKVVPKEMADGNIVDLGEFGSFRLKIKSEGAETPAAVSAHNIKNVLAQFTPGKAFKQVIASTKFKKA